MRWPEGPPHLALNPPYLFFCFCFCFIFMFFGPLTFLICFSLFFVFCFFCSFSFFVFNRKTLFPSQKGIFGLFLSVSLSFSIAFFGLPLFHFFFLCLSLFLSFLPSFLSFFYFLLVSCFCLFLLVSSLLLFHERNNITIFNYKVFVQQSFLIFVGFLSSFSFQVPVLFFVFSLSLSLFFCSTSMFLKNKLKKPYFWSRGGLQLNVFCMSLCFAKCEKLSFFWGAFFCQFLVV